MPNEPTEPQEPNTPQPNPPAEDSGDAPQPADGKTFTEAEVNAMIATRLSKHEKNVRKSIEQEQAEAKRQAELTAEQRATEAEASARKREDEADARVRAAERKAGLAAHFTKPDRVLKLGGDADDYWKDDGTPDLEKLQTDFSEYVPKTTSGPQPENRPAGAPSIDDRIRRAMRGG